MKLSCLFLAVLLASCVEATDQPKPEQFPNAEYAANVSSLYEIEAPSLSGMKEIDFKWKDSVGLVHSLSDLRGRTVLLNVWATGCAWCDQEMPMLDQLQKDRQDIAIIGLSIDNTSHSFKTVLDYATQNHIHYQLVVDSTSSLFTDYVAISNGSYVMPETYIIGSDGNIQALLQGAQTRDAIERWLQ